MQQAFAIAAEPELFAVRAHLVQHRLDAAGAATVVPACPLWNVTDTVAHVVGIIDDLRSGRLDGLELFMGPRTRTDRRPGPGNYVQVRGRLDASGRVVVERLRSR